MKTFLMTMTIALLAAVFSLATAGQAPPPRGLPPIGYINPQRILAESTAAKVEIAKFQAIQAQKTTELRTKQQTLEATRQQLAQTVDSAARTQLQQQEQQQRIDFERGTAQAQTELQTLQRQVNADIQAKLKPVLDDLAKGQNIQLVLNADQAVVWAAPGLDLTSAVIERLNTAKP